MTLGSRKQDAGYDVRAATMGSLAFRCFALLLFAPVLACSISGSAPRGERPSRSGAACDFPELEVAKFEQGRACATDMSPLHQGSFTRCLMELNHAAHKAALNHALAEAGFEQMFREPLDPGEVDALVGEERDRLVAVTSGFATDGRSMIRRVVGTQRARTREYAVCGCEPGRGTPDPDPEPGSTGFERPDYILLEPGETLGPDITYEYDWVSVSTVRTGKDCHLMPEMP